MPFFALTVYTMGLMQMGTVTQINQSGFFPGGNENYISAIAAITTIWPPGKFFPPERNNTVSPWPPLTTFSPDPQTKQSPLH